MSNSPHTLFLKGQGYSGKKEMYIQDVESLSIGRTTAAQRCTQIRTQNSNKAAINSDSKPIPTRTQHHVEFGLKTTQIATRT
jgi:hypothetical protein